MGENRMFGRQEAGVQHYVQFDLRLNRWVPLCGQYMVDGDIEASSKPFYADEPVCTNCREQAGELKRVVFRIAPSMAKSLNNSAIRQAVEKFLSALGQLSESNLLHAIENPPHRVSEDVAVEMEILRRELAQERDLGQRAAEYSRALSAEIERLRGENRLILDALGMEKYRVRWRPVADGVEMPVSGVPVLAVVQVGQKRLVVRATYIKAGQVEADLDFDEAYEYDEEADTYWLNPGWYEHNLVEEIHWQISDPVTHWAPLPGLPEEG